jgi:hypothetical protein
LIFLKDVLGNIDSVFAGGNIAILPPHYHFITLCHPEWSISGIRQCVPSVRRNNKEQITQPSSVSFAVLRGGKDNRHCGHRSRGTYALTHLTPPKQRYCAVWKMRCSSFPLYYGGRQGGVLLSSLTDGVLRHVAKATAQDDTVAFV